MGSEACILGALPIGTRIFVGSSKELFGPGAGAHGGLKLNCPALEKATS